MTDTPGEYRSDTLRTGFAANVVVTCLVVFAVSVIAYSSRLDSRLRVVVDVIDARRGIWSNIASNSERLFRTDPGSKLPPQVVRHVQASLTTLLDEDNTARHKVQDLACNLCLWPLPIVYPSDYARLLNSDVAPAVRKYISDLATTSPALIEARHTSLDSLDKMLLMSGKATAPLQEQIAGVRRLQSGLSTVRTPLDWVVTLILLSAIWLSWFRLLKPSIVRSDLLQQQIVRSEERARITLASISDAVLVTDAEGYIQSANPATARILGVEHASLYGHALRSFIEFGEPNDGGVLLDPVAEVVSSAQPISRRYRATRRNSQNADWIVDVGAAPLAVPGEALAGVVLVMRDITDEIRMREQLRHSEKVRAVGALAAGLAHEFNNALAVILGCNEIMTAKLNLQRTCIDAVRPQLEMVRQKVKQSSALTGQLLAINRRSGFKLTPTDIRLPLETAISVLRQTSDRAIDIRLDVKLEPDQTSVLGDFSSLESVFLNLGLNSLAAIEPPGAIDVLVRYSPGSDNGQASHGQGRITVLWRDTGCGIAASNLAQIFEPFYTSKADKGGVGLGLSVVQNIIEEHRGAIAVQSELGKGTTFTIDLPITREAAHEIAQPAEPSVAVVARGVLMVDDEAKFLELGREYLTSLGLSVLTATNGAEGVDVYRSNRADIDVVILDLNLPQLQGDEVAAAIRALDPDCRIIFSTGRLEGALSPIVTTNENTSVLRKPYALTELAREIARLQASRTD